LIYEKQKLKMQIEANHAEAELLWSFKTYYQKNNTTESLQLAIIKSFRNLMAYTDYPVGGLVWERLINARCK